MLHPVFRAADRNLRNRLRDSAQKSWQKTAIAFRTGVCNVIYLAVTRGHIVPEQLLTVESIVEVCPLF